jgi:hypothetical protein
LTEPRPRAWGLLLALLVLLLPLGAVLRGARGPLSLVLNLGPGDSPYVSGFAPAYEIDDKVGTHWTTYEAAVSLPVTVTGGPVEAAYRFARVLPQTALVEVSAGGQPVDRFECRGGVVQERAAALPGGPVHLAFRVDSHDRKNLGLKMDWIRVSAGPAARIALAGAARFTPVLVLALVLALHVLAGFDLRRAAALTLPWSLAATWGLLADPWLTHRLLRGLPLALALFGLVGVGIGRALLARGRAGADAVRAVAALAVAAFLLRALAVNHPDFYYPDLRTHARLVEVLRGASLDFFVHPSRYIWEHGVWRTEAYGKTYAFPYTPAFHLPFAVLGLPYDSLITAMKLTAAALTVVPLAFVWALARRWAASPLGAVLMVVVPTYTSRLGFAFLPALLGHAVDVAFLYWLAGHLERVREPRTQVQGAVLVAACQLAYVSGVVNISLLVGLLAALGLWLAPAPRARHAAAVLAFGLAGALLAVALYYRDFLGMALDLGSRAGGGGAVSRYPVQSFWAVAYGRTRDFFDGVYPLLAAAGVALLWREDARRRWLLAAWLLTYAGLLLGRARVPDVFLHGHETLLVTPLVCLAAGHALARLADRSRAGRVAAVAAALFLAVQGLAWQWRALVEQLGNAR